VSKKIINLESEKMILNELYDISVELSDSMNRKWTVGKIKSDFLLKTHVFIVN